MVDNFDYLVKILLIGESGVGKTCILQQFIDNKFVNSHLPTIAIDFRMKVLCIADTKLKMQLWDTAGQERFNTLTSASHGVIVTYSITDADSFQQVNKWMDQIRNLGPKNVKVVLVGNKTDLESERKVSYEDGKRLAENFGISFFEVSAKSGENVQQVFLSLGKDILENSELSQSQSNNSFSCIIKRYFLRRTIKKEKKMLLMILSIIQYYVYFTKNLIKISFSFNTYLKNTMQSFKK